MTSRSVEFSNTGLAGQRRLVRLACDALRVECHDVIISEPCIVTVGHGKHFALYELAVPAGADKGHGVVEIGDLFTVNGDVVNIGRCADGQSSSLQ